MYESLFGLTERPFLPGATPERFFPAPVIESARATLVRCLERGEGAALLIGPSGTGKSLLCEVLTRSLRSKFQVAKPDCGRLASVKTLLQAVLFELGRPYRGMDEGELRLSLIDHISTDGHCPGGLLLVVDEAQTLPWRLMDEIRLLTNIFQRGEPRVRLLLAGSPKLEERFTHPKLAQFSQRIAARCYLEPFQSDETAAYVAWQIEHCGGSVADVFTDDALLAIYRATDGIPRLINQVCDHALVLAFAGGTTPIDAAGIEEAWADLQQLPVPIGGSQPGGLNNEAESAGVIEFGELDGPSGERWTTEPDAARDDASEEAVELGPFERGSVASGWPEPSFEIVAPPSGGEEVHAPSLANEGPTSSLEDGQPHEASGSADFADEEVVIDRYGDVRDWKIDRWHTVRCEESRELAAMAKMLEASPSQGSQDQSTSNDQSLDEQLSAEHVAGPRLHAVHDDQGAASEEPLDFNEQQASAEEVNNAEAGDEEVIVVEDTPPVAPSRAKARRREYRSLFSQLRCG